MDYTASIYGSISEGTDYNYTQESHSQTYAGQLNEWSQPRVTVYETPRYDRSSDVDETFAFEGRP